MKSLSKVFIFLVGFAITAAVIWQVDYASKSKAQVQIPQVATAASTKTTTPIQGILAEQAEIQVPPENENPQELAVPILMYHHVGPLASDADEITTNLTVDPEKFEAQLSWLKSQGYQTLTLTQLNQVFFNKRQLPAKPVILTFDDGYADNYQYAFPLLKKYQMSAVIFVITDMRDGWYTSWAELREMAAAGIEIDSHTASHVDLSQLSGAELTAQLRNSKEVLQKELGIKSLFLSYPAGKFNDSVIDEARRQGYLGAVTTQSGSIVRSQRIFEIPRLRVNRDTYIEGLLQ